MRNLLKFAESHESDCFLTRAEDARGDCNYLWDLLISQPQATWETIRGQHATQNEICSCQINHLEIFPCPFTCFLSREICSQERNRHRGRERRVVCAGVAAPGRPAAWHRAEEGGPGTPGPSRPAAYSLWGLGHVMPFCEKYHPGYKSLNFYLPCLATAASNLM